MQGSLGRRAFMRGLAGIGAASANGATTLVEAQQRNNEGPTRGLPRRGEFVIRNAYIITMDSSLGDVDGGDIHVRDGAIVAVGRSLRAPGAMVIDGRSAIVLPGLVDTHWHMWTTFLRCM